MPLDRAAAEGIAFSHLTLLVLILQVYEPAAIAHKIFHLMGVTMYCDEFPESARTMSRNNSSPGSSPKVNIKRWVINP